jgi:DNA-binding response OmpR family regulator
MRILIIEDDHAIATNLCDFLTARNHDVMVAGDGPTGFHLAASEPADVIVLDVCVAGLDGIALCRKLRTEAHLDTPVLVLTARDTLSEKLLGFEAGADDYLVKPFALADVEARLNALYRP